VKEEEEAFLRTLDKGLKRMDEIVANAGGKIIPGKEAFELYDTYGFPLDLTLLIASENNLSVDQQGFENEMKQQKDRSRAATTLDTGDWVVVQDLPSKGFVGYQSLEAETTILRYRQVKTKGKEFIQLVLESTPFYAESGGQVGDKGFIHLENSTIEIIDTKKENDLTIHFAFAIPANLDGKVKAVVNATLRKQTSLHHSATHLLHAALRSVLGTHVAQKGSLVNELQLRFDFSHFSNVSNEELLQIEKLVNQKIRENIPVVIRELPKEEALKLGAMALFGEKYGDVVRVVIMDPTYSVELCGGTHVGYTGELGLFKLVSESAVAAGVRRVEALCGAAAEDFILDQLEQLQQVRELFKNPKELTKSVESQLSEASEMKKKLEQLEQKLLNSLRAELLSNVEEIGSIQFLGAKVEVSSTDALKKLCFDLKSDLKEYLAVLTANINGKPFVAIGISDGLCNSKGLDAGKLIKEVVAPLIKGGGGGQKSLATAGGQEAEQLDNVIAAVREKLN
jgi:alanyl-tRNA synthetase